MTDEPDFYGQELEALDRIARSFDGLLLHRYLRRQLELCLDIGDSGALRALNGRRSLARDLMRHMAQGIEAQTRGGTADDTIIPAGKPVGSAASSGRAALRARFASDWDAEQREFESNFNPPASKSTNGSGEV